MNKIFSQTLKITRESIYGLDLDMLTSINLIFGHSLIFKEFLAYMCLEILDDLHTPNARWLAYCGLHFLAWEFVKVVNCWVVPHLVDHTSILLFFQVNLVGQRFFFWWDNNDIFRTLL